MTTGEPELWDAAERFVYRIYREVGFCDPSPREWVEEYNEYRSDSTFYVVMDNDEIVGAVRTMVGRVEHLPFGRLPVHTIPRSMVVCEFGSLAVDRAFRGLGITNALHRCAVQHTFLSEAEAFVIAVEPWFMDVYLDLYALPMIQVVDPIHYMGSETLAGLVFLDQMINNLIQERPNVLKWVTRGLDPEIWLPGTIDLRI